MRRNLLQRLRNVKVAWYHWITVQITVDIVSEAGEEYTSLYGDSDNQYEEIQGESKFDGLKSIKELLLRVTWEIWKWFSSNMIIFLGVEEGSDEADKTGQGLLRGEEEASQECEC